MRRALETQPEENPECKIDFIFMTLAVVKKLRSLAAVVKKQRLPEIVVKQLRSSGRSPHLLLELALMIEQTALEVLVYQTQKWYCTKWKCHIALLTNPQEAIAQSA